MILWCSQSDDHPKNNLAKFGYLLDMKIEKNQNLVLDPHLQPGTRSNFNPVLTFWEEQNLVKESKLGHHRSPAYDRTFIYIFIICASFWVIQNVMGVLLQVLEIILEVQRKRSNDKITRRKISFPTYKTSFCPFFFFFSLDPF